MASLKDFLTTEEIPHYVVDKVIRETRQKTVPKGTILQSRGDRNHMSYFVREGLLRSYTIDEKGKEHVFMFAFVLAIFSSMRRRLSELLLLLIHSSQFMLFLCLMGRSDKYRDEMQLGQS